MNMKSKLYPIVAALTVVPLVAFAAGPTLRSMIFLVIGYLNMFLVLMMGFAVVVFVFYVIKYFILPNENRSEAGSYVLYSVIGFFVILSFWGIVNVLQNTFGLQNERNRYESWASFSNLFPGGSTQSTPGGGFSEPGTANFRDREPATEVQLNEGVQRSNQYDLYLQNQGQI